MKKIEAIIQRSKLEEAHRALSEIGIDGMTVYEVQGFGRQNRHTEFYRGSEYTVDSLPKIRIDVVVTDQNADPVLEVIARFAKMGRIGDDKVFISEVKEALCAGAM